MNIGCVNYRETIPATRGITPRHDVMSNGTKNINKLNLKLGATAAVTPYRKQKTDVSKYTSINTFATISIHRIVGWFHFQIDKRLACREVGNMRLRSTNQSPRSGRSAEAKRASKIPTGPAGWSNLRVV